MGSIDIPHSTIFPIRGRKERSYFNRSKQLIFSFDTDRAMFIYFAIFQYGLVFGLAFLAAFLTAPLYGLFGDTIGAKILYNAGGILQGLSGVLLGFLTFVEDKSLFLGLSYALRYACEL